MCMRVFKFEDEVITILTVMLFLGVKSMEEIKMMVRDAEKFKDEDDKQLERLQAMDSLYGYALSTKSALDDENLKDNTGAAKHN